MALTTPNMGIRVWDHTQDPYNHDQQADNWSKVDFHDHTPGRGVQIPTEGIFDGSITTSKIAPSFLQVFTATIPNTAAAASNDITVTWATAFADTNYLVFTSVRNSSGGTVSVTVLSKTTTGAVIRVTNTGAATFNSGSLNALAVHQ